MIRRVSRTIWETGMGLGGLGLLFARSRGNLRGDYWHWRWHTAFGRGEPGKMEQLRSILEYARWMHQMRRHR